MDHEYYRDRVSAYVDGALPAYEQMAIEEHIAQCAECRALLEKLRKLEAMVQETSVLGESDYWEKQAQKIEARLGLAQTEVTRISPARSWRGLGWKLTAAAASIVVVGVIGFYSWESIREKTDRPPAQMAPSLPPASVIAPQKVQPEPMKTESAEKPRETTAAKREQFLSRPKIADTENYKRQVPAPGEFKKPTAVISQDVTDSQALISDERAKSASAPVEPVPDGGIKVVSVPAMVHPVDSTTRDVAKVALKSIAGGAQSDVAMQEKVQSDSAEQSAPAVKGLAYWQAIRDSLSVDRSPIREIGESIVRLRDAQPSSLASGLVEKKDSANRHDLLLEAYFRIAQLSKDSTETRTASNYLQRISEDAKSPYQKLARAYLDSLGIK